MTPARRKALQWFHDRGEVRMFFPDSNPPSATMIAKMQVDGQLQYRIGNYRRKVFSLTDKGRRMLHGDKE